MMIKQIVGAVLASTALIGGFAISADNAPEDPAAVTQPAAIQPAASQPAGDQMAAAQPDDGMLAENVKTALTKSPETQAFSINVESKEGIVRLIGAVDNAKAKEAASTVALSVEGVKDVQNEITVTGT